MAQCFSACGCNDLEGVTRADLNRYTDKIDNVLNQDNGRRLFRDFMITAKLKDGVKCLRVWEECDRVINSPAASSTDKKIYEEFLSEVDELIDDADRVENLDFAIMEKLTITRETETKHEIITILKLLRIELTKALSTEYKLFRKHFVTQRI